MTVPLDSSRTYRWPSELVELVESITRTHPHNESTWIEWKSTLDLNKKEDLQHIAKHVLGFANRTVTTAAHHAGGYAYLVVGADPEVGVVGISSVDPATLRPRILRYTGPAPRWRAEIVTVESKVVLVVIVDPPEHGDPIHPVRLQLGDHPKGRVLVRHAGSTDPADEHEIDQLVARVRARPERLAVGVVPVSTVIERLAVVPDIKALVAEERAATLDRPRHGEERPAQPPTGRTPWMTAAAGMQAAYMDPIRRAARSMTEAAMTQDRRSQEEYEAAVDAYAHRYEEALQERYLWRLWHHEPARLTLTLHNLAETNFEAVDLRVHIAGDVEAWPEEWQNQQTSEPGFPKRPLRLGTPTPGFDYSSVLAPRPTVYPTYNFPTPPLGAGFTVENTGSVTITFDDLDLRPEDQVSFDSVPLLVKASAGTVLSCSWTATARNVTGRLRGTFELTVAESTLDLSDLTRDDQ